jgi:uncharacterized protein
MKKELLILSLFIALFNTGYSQEHQFISHNMYHQYQGDFVFEDGTYITGGPMGEVKGSVMYIEPIERNRGGVFVPKTKNVLISAFPQFSKDTIKFKRNYRNEVVGLWWINEKGEKKYAKKEVSPIIEQVKIQNGDITLDGELILPKGKGPFPTIISVHGSGRQDKHGGPWTSFFTRHGIAVLSYDKRGVGKSTGKYETAGYNDLASDVLAGVGFLKKHPKVDNKKIGVKGSSEGGWVGSIVAAKSDDLAFLIVRAGSGESGFETYMHELKNELTSRELTKKELVEALRLQRDFYQLALSSAPIDSINSFLNNAQNKYDWFHKAYGNWNRLTPEYRIKLNETGPVDPVESLRQVTVPTLWFLAEEDENVPYDLSKLRINLALEEAGNEDYQVITLKGAKHNFITQNEDGSFKYVDGYWNKMAEWLKEREFIK